jgi:hypothetical protein
VAEKKLIPDDIKKKPGVRHLRAISLVVGKQIELSKEAAKKGASFKDAVAVKVNQDPEFMQKVKDIWHGKA